MIPKAGVQLLVTGKKNLEWGLGVGEGSPPNSLGDELRSSFFFWTRWGNLGPKTGWGGLITSKQMPLAEVHIR